MSQPLDLFSAVRAIADDPSYERVVCHGEIRLRDSLANVERLLARFGQGAALRLLPHVMARDTRACHRLQADERVYIAPDPWTAHTVLNDVLLNLYEPLVYTGAELLSYPRWQRYSPYVVFGPLHRAEDLVLPGVTRWLVRAPHELRAVIAQFVPPFAHALAQFEYDFDALHEQLIVVEHNLLQPTLWLVGFEREAPLEKLSREETLGSIPLFRAGRVDVVTDDYMSYANVVDGWGLERVGRALEGLLARYQADRVTIALRERECAEGLLNLDEFGWAAYEAEQLERLIEEHLANDTSDPISASDIPGLGQLTERASEAPERPFVQEYGVFASGLTSEDVQALFASSSDSGDDEAGGAPDVAGVI